MIHTIIFKPIMLNHNVTALSKMIDLRQVLETSMACCWRVGKTRNIYFKESAFDQAMMSPLDNWKDVA